MWESMRFCQVAPSFGIVSQSSTLNSINKCIQPKQKTKNSIIKAYVFPSCLLAYLVQLHNTTNPCLFSPLAILLLLSLLFPTHLVMLCMWFCLNLKE